MSDEGAQFDIGAMLSQLGQMQHSLEQAQESAAAEVVEGSAGGGAVRVRVSGALEFQAVIIDPSVVDPDEVDMLQDLVLAAVRDGLDRASGTATRALGSAGLGGPGLGLPGFEGGLGRLLGAPGDDTEAGED